MAGDLQQTGKKPRGFQPGRSGNPAGRRLDLDRLRAAVDGLAAQVVELNNGKPLTSSQTVLVGQIARLQLAKGGDIVRQSRAVADLLCALGLANVRPPLPSMPVVPTLQDYLRQRAAEAAGASESSGGGTPP
jgi:hypothetical protein